MSKNQETIKWFRNWLIEDVYSFEADTYYESHEDEDEGGPGEVYLSELKRKIEADISDEDVIEIAMETGTYMGNDDIAFHARDLIYGVLRGKGLVLYGWNNKE